VLDSIRKNAANSVVLKVLFGVIALVFIFFYVGTAGVSRLEIAARINDKVITKAEVDRAYNNLSRFYRNAAANNRPSASQIRTQALLQVINTELLVQEATKIGLDVDEQELRDSIANIPDFRIDGRFNKTRYLEALRLNLPKPGDFEDNQRRQVLSEKLLGLIRAGVQVSDAELAERFHFENDRVALRFIKVPRADFVDSVSFDDAQLTAYYDENRENFRRPEQTVIRYMAFRPEAFEDQVEPTDTDLEIYFDEHKADFAVKEQVRARHILLRLSPEASDDKKAAVKEKAIGIRKRARDGEDFAELAVEFSEDSTAADGGDLGAFARGVMTPPFEEAAFALEPGGISDLVETQFGIHIIKVEEKIPARSKTLDEVRDEVRRAVQKRESRKLTLGKVEEAFDRLLDGQSFTKVSKAYGVDIVVSEPFARGDTITGLGMQPKIVEAAFATDKDELGEIMNLDNGYLVFEVADRIASEIPPLDDIRDTVEARLRDKLATDAARSRADTILASLQASGDIDAVADQYGVGIQDTGEIGRFGGYIPKLGSAPELKGRAFKLTDENPVAPKAYLVGGDVVVAVLDRRIPADEERLETDRKPLEQRLRAQKETQVISDFLTALRDRSGLELGRGYALTDLGL